MATVNNAGAAAIGVTEGSGASLVILVALIILFGAAGYFTGRLYGRTGMIAVVAGFVATVVVLYTLGGLGFG